jgi:hypothetical protein
MVNGFDSVWGLITSINSNITLINNKIENIESKINSIIVSRFNEITSFLNSKYGQESGGITINPFNVMSNITF